MPTTTQYPNGQSLVSSALTPAQVSVALQTLTCGMLGINPPDLSKVRVDWQTQGQPFENVSADICYLACTPQDVDYSRVRDRAFSGANGPVTETWTYTKGWRVAWCLYGPSAEDSARMIRSALFMDYFNDTLAAINLYPINDPPEVTRIPENINAQWWERADFYVIVYEQVTETIIDGQATSVEVKLSDSGGIVADFIATV